jgi:hypothetical protein
MDAKSDSFVRGLALGLIPPTVIAFVSFVYSVADTKRKDRLDFVRGQIGQLYGPLYRLSDTNASVWSTLGKLMKPRSDDDQLNQNGQWNLFLKNIVIPLNSRIEDTLLSSGRTIRCDKVRDALREFFSFAQRVKLEIAIADDKANGRIQDKSATLPKIEYPKNLAGLVYNELCALRDKERKLDDGWWGLFYLHNPNEPNCAPDVQPSSIVCPIPPELSTPRAQ